MDQKKCMKLYDINKLDDKYICYILIRLCHDNKKYFDGKSYKLLKVKQILLLDLFPLGIFVYPTPLKIHSQIFQCCSDAIRFIMRKK